MTRREQLTKAADDAATALAAVADNVVVLVSAYEGNSTIYSFKAKGDAFASRGLAGAFLDRELQTMAEHLGEADDE